eukprot:TRINITY_DN6495_c0_g1_i2.p1 TRINITY_DN6495_c0_g1~~TRINITY_DN6495_c0_g1_i2.p1  ORF type:complete len:354 (-),score=71.42 TRINITY_DN6495_c0_g1_i2:77-1138(-)
MCIRDRKIGMPESGRENVIQITDYISYLCNFPRLYEIPLHFKDKNYSEYLKQLFDYLLEFIRKSQPLIKIEQYQENLKNCFEEEYKAGTLEDWKKVIEKCKVEGESDPLFCFACQKKFANEHILDQHKRGKKHIKCINALFAKYGDLEKAEAQLPKKVSSATEAQLKEMIFQEYAINKMYDYLNDIIVASINQTRKKLSQLYTERVADLMDTKGVQEDVESDPEEEKKTLHQKKMPVGWDGQPIPLWLYRAHGLGIEYKCEICGGASYWGRRAFERHFQEWRHAYGMKCLKIPNTIHFRDVTRIADAIRLYKKILEDNYKNSFKPDIEEEFEDSDGHILSRKEYIDLQRQGLL